MKNKVDKLKEKKMPKHECQIEIILRTEGSNDSASPKEQILQLMEEIRKGLEDGGCDSFGHFSGGSFLKDVKWATYSLKLINESIISLLISTGVTSPEEWAKSITKDGLLKHSEVRVLHRNSYVNYDHYFVASKGEIHTPDNWNEIIYWCYDIRGVNPEEDWILPNLRNGIDPLESTKEGVSRFREFCKQRHLDFWSLFEYATLFNDVLWDCLKGETNHVKEYEKLKQEGKIPNYYLNERDKEDEPWVGYSL